uniref:kelch-like ECH-associated protein 1 n=1 Tax=Styela clava TaxID=7725 RepID=UPI00193A70A8|nr:kelch-like ECH-associated protein 1 [Styela clava]
MKEVKADSVGRCIDYIYIGNASITFQKSEQLLHVANIMQLPTLCEEIAEFLKANLGPNSFFVIKKIAVKFSLKNLEEACDKYAVSHLGSIAKEEEFNQLDKEYVELVSEKSIQLRSLCEDMKTSCYTAVVLEDFVYVLRPDKKVYRVNLWGVNSSWTEMPNMNKDHGSNLRAVVHANFIYVYGNYTLERFGNHWQNIGGPDHSLPCYGTLVACRDDIYIIGSYVIKYSPSKWSSLRMKSMNVARKNPAATVYNGRIYVAGGGDKISSAEFFDPDTNTWANLAPMRIPRCNFSLCVVDKILFAVGNNGTLSVEKYDLGRKQWIIVSNVPSMSIVPAACNTIRIPLYY